MRAWKASLGILLGALAVCCSSAAADDKPDALALLKQHPEFATLTKVTDITKGGAVVDITLCRHKNGNCERFEAKADKAADLADYVYLFAAYKGKYAASKPATPKSAKPLADGFLQEVQDKGYGQSLLDFYSSKMACGDQKDIAGCVLHKLFGSIGIQRYIVERTYGGGVSILTADEDGTGDPFLG